MCFGKMARITGALDSKVKVIQRKYSNAPNVGNHMEVVQDISELCSFVHTLHFKSIGCMHLVIAQACTH